MRGIKMQCPRCATKNVIEFYPVFTYEMRLELVEEGLAPSEIQYEIDRWENQQLPTGGTCLDCRFEWSTGIIASNNYVSEPISS